MEVLKRVILTVMAAILLLPLGAQERSDTVYVFRFVADRDMFYVPWNGNGDELSRLEACVEELKMRIVAGEVPIFVDGYCDSQESESGNLSVAKIRSNRVKSELIVRQGLTEDCFRTTNHSGEGDFVAVRIAVPAEPQEDAAAEEAERLRAEQERAAREEAAKAERRAVEEAERTAQAKAEAERQAELAAIAAQAEADSLAHADQERAAGKKAPEARPTDNYALALRANLLRLATLTPDLGLEWRISPSVGVLVNGSWTSWTWKDNDRRYALWEVAPEVRWYLGETYCWYVGTMYKAGQFNYKLGSTGRQGDIMGGGLTGGYQLRLNKALSMDFSLGLGYLNADYEDYVVTDAVRVRDGFGTKGWWGPINAGVTLVWKIF